MESDFSKGEYSDLRPQSLPFSFSPDVSPEEAQIGARRREGWKVEDGKHMVGIISFFLLLKGLCAQPRE